MKYPKLSKGYSIRGADMGRDDIVEEPNAPIKFHLYRMPMSYCGCYDSGGAYWGSGDFNIGFMYHAYGDGPEFKNYMFIRAKTRQDAKEQIKKVFKNCSFYR